MALIIENLVRDARHVSRGLRRRPGFALTVVLTLALGIGTNTRFSSSSIRFFFDRFHIQAAINS